MPNYANGKIYSIRFRDNDKFIYIGSTTQPLAVRFGGHKKKCNNSAVKQFIQSNHNGDWTVCYIELYETYACNSKEELNKKEGEVIRQYKNNNNYICINKEIAGRTLKQYYEDNKENIKKQKMQYYEDNKDKISKYHQQYYEDNKDKIREQHNQYIEDHKETIKKQSKQYYEDNKDKKKQYYEDNKDKINIKKYEKLKCECGSYYTFSHRVRHFQTTKHQNNLSSGTTAI
jgi:hypothetical protein